jgi:hypothetical protein
MGKETNAVIRTFASRVRKKFDTQKIILFGSRARGDWLKTSDYDFIIVSNDFQGVHFLERQVKVLLETKAYFAADMLCYTVEEFERKRKQAGIVSQALKEGIVVYSA